MSPSSCALLVAGAQVAEHLAHLVALLLHVVGHHGGEVVVLVLFALPVGDVGLRAEQLLLRLPHGLVCGDGDQVDGQHEVCGQRRQLAHGPIQQKGGVRLAKQHAGVLIPEHQVVGVELHALWADGVGEVMSPAQGLFVLEPVVDLVPGAVEVVEHAQPLVHVHGLAPGAQRRKPGRQIHADAVEIGASLLDALFADGHRDVPLLDHAVAVGRALQQHVVVLPAIDIQRVPLQREQRVPPEHLPVDAPVVKGDLGRRAHVQRIEQAAVGAVEHLPVLVRGDRVVYIGKLPGHAVFVVHHKDAVGPDAPDGDGLLHRPGDGERGLVLL